MNDFTKGQIRALIQIIKQSEKTMMLSAMQDDGIITKVEQKELNKLSALNIEYIKALRKMIEK